jgi:thiol-disulfide isomerase/thioredoxin
VTLSDYRGQWVILNFWATWCPPCVEEMPYLNQLAAERDLVVLGVNFNEDRERVAAFVAEQGIDFPILLAPDEITLLFYGVRGLPRTFVIAPDGALAHTAIGALRPAEFSAWLDAQGL